MNLSCNSIFYVVQHLKLLGVTFRLGPDPCNQLQIEFCPRKDFRVSNCIQTSLLDRGRGTRFCLFSKIYISDKNHLIFANDIATYFDIELHPL